MRRAVFILTAFAILGTAQAQIVKLFTVQITNPSTCAACCNGTIGVQGGGWNCGAITCTMLMPPATTFTWGGPTCSWSNLCNGIYTVGAVVYGDSTCWALCGVSSGYFNPLTGVANNYDFQSENFEVFPNPGTDLFNIKVRNQNLPFDVVARLMNGTGNIIKEEKLVFIEEVASFRMSRLPPGIYSLELLAHSQNCGRRRVLIE